MSVMPTEAAPSVAGYSGVTANGSGYTGAAPIPARYGESSPYQGVLYGDSGKLPPSGVYDLAIAERAYLAARLSERQGPAIIADDRTPEQHRADERFGEYVMQKMAEYPDFDPGMPGAWTYLAAQERAAGRMSFEDMLGLLDGISKGRLAPTYYEYYLEMTSAPTGAVRAAGPPRK